MTAKEKQGLNEFWKKNFKVRLEKSRYDFDTNYDLLVTHNGNQWSGINLNKIEAKKVIKVLSRLL